MHNFAGEVNVRKFNSCVNPINKQIKFDLKKLANWSNANKIFFNISKIELALFDRDLKVKLNGKRLYESDSVKYLGIQIEKFTLAWKQKINQDAVKLNKVDPAVSKLRHLLDVKCQRSVFYAKFILYLSCLGTKH